MATDVDTLSLAAYSAARRGRQSSKVGRLWHYIGVRTLAWYLRGKKKSMKSEFQVVRPSEPRMGLYHYIYRNQYRLKYLESDSVGCLHVTENKDNGENRRRFAKYYRRSTTEQ